MGTTNGKLWIPAWQLHDRDPTLILWKAVYNNMENNMMRKNNIARLHIFPEDEVMNNNYKVFNAFTSFVQVPEDILSNVTAQIPQLRAVPKTLNDYSEGEKENFPHVFTSSEDFVKQ